MKWKWPIGIAFLVLIAGGAWIGYTRSPDLGNRLAALVSGQGAGDTSSSSSGGQSSSGTSPNTSAVTVSATAVVSQTLSKEFTAFGTVDLGRRVSLTANQRARIEQILFEDGQRVKAGDPLVVLEDADARSDLEAAQASFNQRQSAYNRTSELQRNGQATVSSVETASSDLASARARLRSAQRTVEELTLVAPFDGILGVRQVEAGSQASLGQTIVSLQETVRPRLELTVPAKLLADLREGQLVYATNRVFPDLILTGVVEIISPLIDTETGSVELLVELDQNAPELREGLFVTAKIAVGQIPNALVVPESAVAVTVNGASVFVVKDSVVDQVSVKIVERQNGVVAIDGEIQAGDQVVTTGIFKLADGMRVATASGPAS